jgi:hypothetical protein
MKNPALLLFFAAAVYNASILPCQTPAAPANPVVRPMRQLYVEDQRDRGVLLSDSGDALKPGEEAEAPKSLDGETVIKRDAGRRAKVREIMARGQLATAQDFHDAAFIFQHGADSNDYLLAHILAIEAVAKGDPSSKWIAAATLDRYLQAIGQKQVFGTQYLDEKYAYYLKHRGDADLADKSKNIPDDETQQPYDDQLLSDAVRLDFCVPGVTQQAENLKVLNEGKYPEKIVPPGCVR